MSDPQDLLYTNNYTSTNILSEQNINKDIEYYNRFTDYQDKNSKSDYVQYIEDNEYEQSQINLNKTLDTKWPVNNKKNHYPLFDTYINDISTDRYKKEVITQISIDNINRDIGRYKNPNSFTINLPRTFNNVKKIVINDINFRNINQSVTNVNNNLAWQYPSANYLLSANVNTTIIPVPGSKTIMYNTLPTAVYKYVTTNGSGFIANIDNYLVYQTSITPGFYNIDLLINNLRMNTSKIIHGENYVNNNIDVIEEPYLTDSKKIGSSHLFSFSINPLTSNVQIVNRIEELNIIAIQTFSPYETNYSNTDMFYYYSSLYSSSGSYTLDNNFIYITVEAGSDTSYQYYYNIYCLKYCNPFPLVITDLIEDISGIDTDLICYTPFFDLNIYLNNCYIEEDI